MAPALVWATGRTGGLLFAAMGLVGAVVLGGNGVQPREIVSALESSVALRAGCTLAWTSITFPVARACLNVPSTWWLRSLPVSRAVFVFIHGAGLLLCVEALYAGLIGVGGGWLAGGGVALSSAAVHAVLGARPWRARDVPVAVVALATLAMPLGLPQRGLGLMGLMLALPAAVVRAPDAPRSSQRARLFGRASLALALSYALALWRREPATLRRGGLMAFVGGAAVALAIRNNEVTEAGSATRILLGAGGAALAVSCVGVAVAAWRAERRDRWLLDAMGTNSRQRVAATAGLSAGWGALLGAAQAALASFGTSQPVGGAMAIQACWGAALGALLSATLRWRLRDEPEDDQRAFVLVLFAVAAAALTGALVGPLGVAIAALLALGCLTLQARTPSRPPEEPPTTPEEPP